MDGYFIRNVGSNRGRPRIWLQGLDLERAGFTPGQSYEIGVKGKTVVMTACSDGTRVVTPKKVRSRTLPVIDLNSRELLAVFDGMAAVRVVIKANSIFILPLASELKKQERFQRLKDRLDTGQPLRIGSLSHGGGIMSNAIHHGLDRAGIPSRLGFANEIRPELLEHASQFNDAWDEDTVPLNAPMQELAFDERGLAHIPQVEILEAGIPCSGASRAGTAKRGLKHPEAHPEVGHLVVPTLMILNKAAPAICIFECVIGYANSASASILRTQLRELGYTTHERILSGKEWALENRDRWCMVAVTQGLDFDFDQLVPPAPHNRTLGDDLEDVPDGDPRWQKFSGLVAKQERDLAKGSNFRMQVFDAEATSVSVLTKGYSKVRSTDPRCAHPSDPELMRQYTPLEHSRFKGIPERLLGDASPTIQHEILGQSVIYEKFVDVGHHVGNSINRFAGRPEVEFKNRKAIEFAAEFGIDQQAAELAAEVVAELHRPEVAEGLYAGQIVAIGNGLVIQQTANMRGVLHDVLAFRDRPSLGEVVEIQYRNGTALIAKTAPMPTVEVSEPSAVAGAKARFLAENGSTIPADYFAPDDDQVPAPVLRMRPR